MSSIGSQWLAFNWSTLVFQFECHTGKQIFHRSMCRSWWLIFFLYFSLTVLFHLFSKRFGTTSFNDLFYSLAPVDCCGPNIIGQVLYMYCLKTAYPWSQKRWSTKNDVKIGKYWARSGPLHIPIFKATFNGFYPSLMSFVRNFSLGRKKTRHGFMMISSDCCSCGY